MTTFELSLNNESVRVKAMRGKEGIWFHLKGRTYFFANQKTFSQEQAQDEQSEGQVLAPMPGKIIKVLVKDGETVSAGQALIVMEAMKMEYTLKAPISGKVKSVKSKEGDQVKLGQEVASVEAESDE